MLNRLVVGVSGCLLFAAASIFGADEQGIALDVKDANVTVKLVGREKLLPKEGCKVFMSRNGTIRDLHAHPYEDRDLYKMLHNDENYSRDGSITVTLVVAEPDTELSKVQTAAIRIAKQANTHMKTAIIISFATITIKTDKRKRKEEKEKEKEKEKGKKKRGRDSKCDNKTP